MGTIAHCLLLDLVKKGRKVNFIYLPPKQPSCGVASGWFHYSIKGRCSSPPGGPLYRLFLSQVLEMDPTFFLSCMPDTQQLPLLLSQVTVHYPLIAHTLPTYLQTVLLVKIPRMIIIQMCSSCWLDDG